MPSKRTANMKAVDVSGKKPKMTQSTLIKSSSDDANWKVSNSLLIYTHPEVKPSAKIFAMDMDGTLISTASGKTFPVDYSDWRLFSPNVLNKAKHFHDLGFKLVIISNQYGIAKGHVRIPEFRIKVENIVKRVGVPMQAFFSILPDHNRKPDTGMWERLVAEENGGITADMSTSLYCGDAAGRPARFDRKKDHSCGDRLFARNLSLRFMTPEEIWLDQKDAGPFSLPSFDPVNSHKLSTSTAMPSFSPPAKTEMLILVGYPGAGKSHFCKNVLQPLGYTVVNRDTLGTWQKCVKVCEEAIQKGESVAIDNTNVDAESRRRYIQVAEGFSCPVRCLLLDTSIEHSKHNDRFRALTVEHHKPIGDMVYNMSRSKYQEPSLNEGFSEILKIPFVLDQSMKDKSLYCRYLLDK